MRRYFMTIPEAAQLVLQAGGDGRRAARSSCSTWASRCKIVDLARDLIRLSGLRPDNDIEIDFTGLRPGEKLFEELHARRGAGRQDAPREDLVGRVATLEWDRLERHLRQLRALADAGSDEATVAKLEEIIPEYRRSVSADEPLGQVVPLHPALARKRLAVVSGALRTSTT